MNRRLTRTELTLKSGGAGPRAPRPADVTVRPLAKKQSVLRPRRRSGCYDPEIAALFKSYGMTPHPVGRRVAAPLELLEFEQVTLVTNGSEFSLFDGDCIDPMSNAIPAGRAKLEADAEHVPLGAFCDDRFTDRNPFHFVTDRLARLHQLRTLAGIAEQDCFLGGGDAPYARFARERVAPASRLLASDKPYRFERLFILSTSSSPKGLPFFFLDRDIVASLVPPLLTDLPASQFGTRLYLARTDATRRPLVNELELASRLEDEGFDIIEMSKLAPEEQLATCRNAEIIVAPHGASLTNVIAMTAGSKLIELFNPSRGSCCYAALSRIAPVEYHPLFGAPVQSARKDAWSIDIDDVVREIRLKS